MKKLNLLFTQLTLLICIASAGSLLAQSAETTVNHELGIRFFGLSNFNLIYKKQKDHEKFFRYRLGFTNFNYSRFDKSRTVDVSAGFALGPERRRAIAEKLKFINGFELQGNFGVSSIKNNNSHQERVVLGPGVGLVLGFQYVISEKFNISLEAIPSLKVTYTFDNGPTPNQFQVNGGFNTDAVALSMVYCFSTNKKKS